MSPSRTPYKPRRDRRELLTAVLGVVVVLAFTVAMVFVLAPDTEDPVELPPAATTIPPIDLSTTTVPGSTVPGESTTAPTTAPASSSTSSSTPG
jgi:hypothetical protein